MKNKDNAIMGIYKITNMVNNKIYIGSSNSIYRRWREHRHDLKANVHHNKHLQRSWNKYEEDNFKFEIVETVLKLAVLLDREQYWIDSTNCINPDIGYNMAKNANRPTYLKTIKTCKSEVKKLVIDDTLSDLGIVLLFKMIPFISDYENTIVVKANYPTQEEMMTVVNMKKTTYYKCVRELVSKNILINKKELSVRKIYVNPNYFSNDKYVYNEIYEMFAV